MEILPGVWNTNEKIQSTSYQCGYCQKDVASIEGTYCQHLDYSYQKFAKIAICPHCNFPTIFSDLLDQRQIPMPKKGGKIEGVKENIEKLYEEVRSCYSIGSFNAAVLLARKLLMNIAVDKGADEGEKFQFYVDYLSNQFIAPNNRSWVDKIRLTGNIATHEIPDINKEDAEEILLFVEMLLRLVYEFPSKLI
ncbi:DUF4145 domain-containing protein [Bacillus altitudinis]|uniref:DUF4145 domain-containing protein n=1 Tax=Bacillus altitudinis TaxID=293387 RepID=UPI0021007171|nr:DUF4145 domain-containing protein [Bacillus altitudinis]UTV31679.1 DUF4145 domain-containing protein [Bacillus altitudinis]